MLKAKNKCQNIICNKDAIFGHKGTTTRLFCKTHKIGDMINVQTKRCTFVNCEEPASYGIESKKPLYCRNHKGNNINVMESKKYIFLNV
jgi:hypothetical protein